MKKFRKTTFLTLVSIGMLLLTACGSDVTDTVQTEVAENDSAIEETTISEETQVTDEAEEVVEIVEPDYCFGEEMTLTRGETVNLEEGITFTLKALDYVESTDVYRADYIMVKDGEEFPGRYFIDCEGKTTLHTDVYNIHPVTFVSANDKEAVFVVSAAPEIPAPMEISGNAEDIYTTEDFEYIVGDRCNLYLEKGITFRGNIMEDLENVMAAVEKESGFEFYVENKYSAMRTTGIRELYFGKDPWPGVDEFHDKIGVYVVNQPERGLVSCSFGCAILITAEDFDIEKEGIYVLAHELSHAICDKNGERLTTKLSEGFACYMGSRVAKSLTQYPMNRQAEESYYWSFPLTLNRNTAEELFLTDFEDYVNDFKEYQYGMYFMTFLYETYGDQAFHDFLQAVNQKNDEFYTSATIEMQVEALKETVSENIFAEFGEWYEKNKSRFEAR